MSRVLAIDVGGTKAAVRAVTFGAVTRGTVAERTVAERTVRWEDGTAAGDLRRLREAAAGLGAGRPDAVAVAFPGTLDASGVVTRWPTRPSWRGIDLPGLLREWFGVRPLIGDDAVFAAYAEAHARDVPTLFYLGLGTGVGGAYARRGDPPERVTPCEAGHVVVRPDAPERCDCGRHGCLQAYASGPRVLAEARWLRGRPVTPSELAAGLRAGHRWAHAALDPAVAALGLTVADLAELLAPAVVAIGGGLGAGVPALTDRVRAEATRRLRAGTPAPDVRPARFGARASLEGAVLAATRTLPPPATEPIPPTTEPTRSTTEPTRSTEPAPTTEPARTTERKHRHDGRQPARPAPLAVPR
ncbi:ROK family protein [Actinomadura viridis]|uniref:ROK family protein n=1 Tax=Actinomadura viridis TaxID=58110 RepID=UPI003698C956